MRERHIIKDRIYVRGVSFWMNWLFLKVSSSLCYSNLFQYFSTSIFSDPPLMEGFPHYIVPSNPFPSSTCLSSNPVLKYLSYWVVVFHHPPVFLWAVVVENTVQTSSPHQCGQESCCSAFNAVVAVFSQDIFIFLSLPCALEVYLRCWNFLEGCPS